MHRKRLITIFKHYIELGRVVRHFQNDLDLAMIGFAIGIGQLEKKPMDISSLAAFLGIPRSTVHRKCQILVRDWNYKLGRTEDGRTIPSSTSLDTNSERLKIFEELSMKAISKLIMELSIVENEKAP